MIPILDWIFEGIVGWIASIVSQLFDAVSGLFLDEAIKSVWENNIKSDYDANWILNEDGLKNALYFHLRMWLEQVLVENDLRIFTEFKDAEFHGSKFRPDMVIANVDSSSDADYWRQAVTNCVVVIELKFKSRFQDKEAIYADYDKLKEYIEKMDIKGKLYMATIWECEDDQTSWIPQDESWAKGKVTELNASLTWESCESQFYVKPH